jgi:hypothetical protein
VHDQWPWGTRSATGQSGGPGRPEVTPTGKSSGRDSRPSLRCGVRSTSVKARIPVSTQVGVPSNAGGAGARVLPSRYSGGRSTRIAELRGLVAARQRQRLLSHGPGRACGLGSGRTRQIATAKAVVVRLTVDAPVGSGPAVRRQQRRLGSNPIVTQAQSPENCVTVLLNVGVATRCLATLRFLAHLPSGFDGWSSSQSLSAHSRRPAGDLGSGRT